MPKSLKLVFCGTPEFAVPSLEILPQAGFQIALVVTQPDRPRGRGMELGFSPVKASALKLNLPVVQPEKIKNNLEFRQQLTEISPDAIIVVGYGRIIPGWMIDLPRMGNLNVHASLLPKYRGAAPIQWAIANGEVVTGVTTMRIDAGLDTGDMLLQGSIPIDPEDTSETLSPRLASLGAALLVETLHGLQRGTVKPVPQDHSLATLAPILKKEDGQIDFSRRAPEILNRLRGFQPWPGAFTIFRGKTLGIASAQLASEPVAKDELSVERGRLLVGCGGQSSLELLEVQPEGKKRMPAAAFINGYQPRSGDQLGVALHP